MNSLIQQKSTLIGSEEDIELLEKKDSARLLVLSDSHGDLEVVIDIILHFGRDADALVYCGDGFCDLIAYFEEAWEDEKMQSALPPVIIPVRGNGDSEVYPFKLNNDEEDDKSFFNFSLSTKVTCDIAGRGIFVTHGDHYRVDMGTDTLLAAAHAVDSDMVFFGHTHKTHWEETGGTLILNPGSCSASRSPLPPSFSIVSFPGKLDRFKIEFYGVEKNIFKKNKFVQLSVHMN